MRPREQVRQLRVEGSLAVVGLVEVAAAAAEVAEEGGAREFPLSMWRLRTTLRGSLLYMGGGHCNA